MKTFIMLELLLFATCCCESLPARGVNGRIAEERLSFSRAGGVSQRSLRRVAGVRSPSAAVAPVPVRLAGAARRRWSMQHRQERRLPGDAGACRRRTPPVLVQPFARSPPGPGARSPPIRATSCAICAKIDPVRRSGCAKRPWPPRADHPTPLTAPGGPACRAARGRDA